MSLLLVVCVGAVCGFSFGNTKDADKLKTESVDLIRETISWIDEKKNDTSDVGDDPFIEQELNFESLDSITRLQVTAYIQEYQQYIKHDSCLQQLNPSADIIVTNIEFTDAVHWRIDTVIHRSWKYNAPFKGESESKDPMSFCFERTATGICICSMEGLFDQFQRDQLESYGIDIQTETGLTSFIKSIESYVDVFYSDTYEKIHASNDMLQESLSNQTNSVKSTTYNRMAAVSYANTYAMSPNTAYYYFPGGAVGKDCTNFVSQCLYAGNIPMHSGTLYGTNCWYYTSSSNYSSCWTVAKHLQTYLHATYGMINSTITNYNNCAYGDLIQLLKSSNEAYHSMIITGFDYPDGGTDKGNVYICCHSAERKNANVFTTYPTLSYTYQWHKILGGK